MSSAFRLGFPLFKEKLQEFITSSSFETKTQEYKTMLEKIRSAAPQQKERYLHTSADYLQTVEKGILIMERIVSLHDELEKIFKMNEEELGVFCDHDLTKAEKVIGQGLQEAAALLYQFETVSQQGKKIIEVFEDPFLSQGS